MMDANVRTAMIEQLQQRMTMWEERANAGDGGLTSEEEATRATEAKTLDALKNWKESPKPPGQLLQATRLGNYLDRYSVGKPIQGGAEQELNSGLGLNLDSAVPWEAIAPMPHFDNRAGLEMRADDLTTVTAGDWQQNVHPVLGRVFANSDGAALGAMYDMVESGRNVYPVLTGGVTASSTTEGTDVDADDASFTAQNLDPLLLIANYKFGVTTRLNFGDMLEQSLRDDLAQEISNRMDNMIINGSGIAPQPQGVLAALTNPTAPTNVATWLIYRGLVRGALDFVYGKRESDVRILLGDKAYNHAGGLFRSANADSMDAIEAIRALGAMVNGSAQLPDAASNVEQGIVTSQGMSLVVATWQGVDIIRDDTSNARGGVIRMTAQAHFNCKVRRTNGWKQVAFKVA